MQQIVSCLVQHSGESKTSNPSTYSQPLSTESLLSLSQVLVLLSNKTFISMLTEVLKAGIPSINLNSPLYDQAVNYAVGLGPC